MPMLELSQGLKKAKDGTHVHFALVAQGSSGKLFVATAKVNEQEPCVKEAKAKGGTLFLGTCFAEEGVMIFQTKKAPDTLAALLKSVMRKDAGISMPVKTRTAAEAGGDDAPDAAAKPAATSPRPSGAPPVGKVALVKRLNALTAPLADLVSTKDPRAKEAARLIAAATSAADTDVAAAAVLVGRAEELIGRGAAPAKPEAPASAAPAFGEREKKERGAIAQLLAKAKAKHLDPAVKLLAGVEAAQAKLDPSSLPEANQAAAREELKGLRDRAAALRQALDAAGAGCRAAATHFG